MRGSLHCAADDKTVRCSGRDDAFFFAVVISKSFCGCKLQDLEAVDLPEATAG